MTGIGRTKFYELVQAGEIEVIKVGTVTLVPMASLEALSHHFGCIIDRPALIFWREAARIRHVRRRFIICPLFRRRCLTHA
jgi:hypothetical protein